MYAISVVSINLFFNSAWPGEDWAKKQLSAADTQKVKEAFAAK
jgi:hypothetical protein